MKEVVIPEASRTFAVNQTVSFAPIIDIEPVTIPAATLLYKAADMTHEFL